jgi:hypothetical protein
MTDYLEEIGSADPGNERREELGYIFRLAGSGAVERALWDILRGQDRLTIRGRTALLVLLFDLGEFNALSTLFENAGENKKYLNAFLSLTVQAVANPSPKLISAIRQNWMTLQARKVPRPFQEFAKQLMSRIRLGRAQVEVEVSETLEPFSDPKCFRMLVTLRPDESDPPLSLRMELLNEGDFTLVGQDVGPIIITDEILLLSPEERELVVRPKDRSASKYVMLQLTGETASGFPIDNVFRLEVRLGGSKQTFERIEKDTLLEIYEGYKGEAVSGKSFVGRTKELESLERAVAGENPGAVLLYGARRLGKTSLLDELRRRRCVTYRPSSRTLFLVIPVDTFEVGTGTKNFGDSFFRLIYNSVYADPKNALFRQQLEHSGINSRRIREVAHLDESLLDAPFLLKLREYLNGLQQLANDRFIRIVLVMDEFDKLLENYRKGYVNEVEELINQLRRAATEEKNIGIILAGSDLMRRITGHYRSALYGSAIEVELGYFNEDQHKQEAREIIAPHQIAKFREFPPEVVQEVVRITGGHPWYMRLIGCVTSYISSRQRISIGTVMEATRKFLDNNVLQGDLPGPMHLVLQPLQALRLMETPIDETLGRLLLLQLARHTSLERPWAQWAVISQDEHLLSLRSSSVWMSIRNSLRDAGLLSVDQKFLWSVRLPILGEALRKNWEVEYPRLFSEIEALIQEG